MPVEEETERRQTVRDDALAGILRVFHRESCYPEAMPHEVKHAVDQIKQLFAR